MVHHNGPFGETTPPEPFSYDIPGPDDHYRATRFVGVSGEIIYRALSPYTDALGVAFYAEPTVGPGFYELETKLILQKNFLDDRLIFAFNYTYAPELRYISDTPGGPENWQEETDTNAYFAGSFRFRANWSAGFEFLNEREYDTYNYSHATNSGFFLGPSFHYGGKKFFVTATFLEQLPWAATHKDTTPGAILGGRDFDNDFEKYRVRIKVGFYLFDEVVGKHEFITYAVGINADGHVAGVEIVDYRESYGYEVRNADWRAQFIGKSSADPLQLTHDIRNVSGATLSCKHVTDGVKRVLATHAIALK